MPLVFTAVDTWGKVPQPMPELDDDGAGDTQADHAGEHGELAGENPGDGLQLVPLDAPGNTDNVNLQQGQSCKEESTP